LGPIPRLSAAGGVAGGGVGKRGGGVAGVAFTGEIIGIYSCDPVSLLHQGSCQLSQSIYR
jgi:hypothetical protein